jgi:hypothetical protein
MIILMCVSYGYDVYLRNPTHIIPNLLLRLNPRISNSHHIFIVGIPRSGTTLIHRVLSAHSNLFSTIHESNFFSFNDLMCSFFGIELKKCELLLNDSKCIVSFFDRLVEFLKVENFANDKIFIEKTPQHLFKIKFLLKYFPNSKFIHVVRDGRDCYCSGLLRGDGFIPQAKRGICYFAQYWKKGMKIGIEVSTDPRVYTFKYCDFVSNPEFELKKMMSFLGLEIEYDQLHKKDEASDIRSKTILHRNLYTPIDSKSVGSWKSVLSDKDNEIFVDVAGDCLTKFGYLHKKSY